MRQGAVYSKDMLAGYLTEDSYGYTFSYNADYLETPGAKAVSLTLPLRYEPYRNNTMFPFFDGLIPEGWLLDVASHNWKINPRDRMGLLLACCADCIGAISVKPLSTNSPEQ